MSASAQSRCRRNHLSAGTPPTKEYHGLRRRGARDCFLFRAVVPLPLERLFRLRGCHFFVGREGELIANQERHAASSSRVNKGYCNPSAAAHRGAA
jgi:hypothetical protein